MKKEHFKRKPIGESTSTPRSYTYKSKKYRKNDRFSKARISSNPELSIAFNRLLSKPFFEYKGKLMSKKQFLEDYENLFVDLSNSDPVKCKQLIHDSTLVVDVMGADYLKIYLNTILKDGVEKANELLKKWIEF
ncbi:MAG: hypothetical protein PHQ98_03880 [Candidatus ainarchaeum sp.]|nr:hypothetical protein [Candidatus ainarchaeum sp.]